MIEKPDSDEAMDIQILQKILPKFHGTQAKLEEPLMSLLNFCAGEAGDPQSDATNTTQSAPFPRSARKLKQMLHNLRQQGYTSFIE